MMRAVAGGGTLQNGGFNFRPNRPSGCGDTGVGVSGSVGETRIANGGSFFGWLFG